MTKTPGVSLTAIASPTRTPRGTRRTRPGRGSRTSMRQSRTMKALTWPKRMPSPTGCSQSIGAVRAASASGTHSPVRWMRRYPAYQVMPAVAATWAAVQSHPTAPNGRNASGIDRIAAKGG